MAIDERSRHELYQRLEQVLGTQEADTMMELLPPVGWADVATKHDLTTGLDSMGTQLRTEMEAMRHELRAEFANQTRQLVLTLVPVIVAVNGMGVALAALLG
jgi:hypothetical protein